MRLRGVLDSAAKSIPEEQLAAACGANRDIYERFRPQVREALAEELWSEFDRSPGTS
jgi:hypothetical protein